VVGSQGRSQVFVSKWAYLYGPDIGLDDDSQFIKLVLTPGDYLFVYGVMDEVG